MMNALELFSLRVNRHARILFDFVAHDLSENFATPAFAGASFFGIIR
jgi:hypothetical protein